MTNQMTRNLQLARTGLDKEEIRYFSTTQSLIAYTPCKADLKHRTLRPTTLRVTITPNDSGLLFESSLPVCVQVSGKNERLLILKRLAKENYGTIRGGLTLTENGHLHYRLFYMLGEDATCFDEEEIAAALKLCAAALSDGYETVVNALDEIDNDIDDDSDDTPESINAELEALFDRLFASRTEAEPSLVLGQENSTSEAIDDDTDEPDGDSSVDHSLRSLLDDFLNDETSSE